MKLRSTIQFIFGCLLIFVSCEDKKDPSFEILFDPSEYQYGKVEINKSVSQKIRIKNTDNSSEAFVGEINILGSPSFRMDFTGVLTLQKNESKEVFITFQPSASQEYNAKISVKNEYAFNEMYLYGEGVAPVSFSYDQSKLEFGLVESGEIKDLDINFTNNASSGFDLELTLSVPSSDFSILDATSSLTVSPGQSESVTIRFAPTVVSSSKTLKVSHNSTVRPNPSSIQLTGLMDQSTVIISNISDGWTQFENGSYSNSRQSFQDAMNKAMVNSAYDSVYGESMHGRGWAALFDQNMSLHGTGAYIDFANVLTDYGTKVAASSKLDCLAGKAISGALIGGSVDVYNTVVNAAVDLLNQSQYYQFSHKTSVDHKDVRMALIQAYYYLGKYIEASSHMDILDPLNAPHSSDPGILLSSIQMLAGSL
tara:strand:- start:939 stop:2210 length:1272 start_codon:yes stop_codon:yes gene_type:complete